MVKPITKLAEPRMYTVKDAAAFFSMSISWVRERIKAGELEGFLCGNLLVSGASMNRYLRSRSIGPINVPMQPSSLETTVTQAAQPPQCYKLQFEHGGKTITLFKLQERADKPWHLRVIHEGKQFGRSTGTANDSAAIAKARDLLDALWSNDVVALQKSRLRMPFAPRPSQGV